MMSFYVPWLVDAARAAAAGTGKQVIVSPGWESRGHGGMRVVEGVVGHHTATPESAPGDYPTLGVVRDGRAGLEGPLAHYGLGRSGNVYVIAAGLCYHAGASAYAGFVDLNDEFLGIEAEDSGDGVWNDAQFFMYPRLVRACLDYMRRGVDRYASHRTVAVPAGRKNDPWGISDQWMRERAAIALQQGNQEEDMTPYQANVLDRCSLRIAAVEQMKDHLGPVKITPSGTGGADDFLDEPVPIVEAVKALQAGQADLAKKLDLLLSRIPAPPQN